MENLTKEEIDKLVKKMGGMLREPHKDFAKIAKNMRVLIKHGYQPEGKDRLRFASDTLVQVLTKRIGVGRILDYEIIQTETEDEMVAKVAEYEKREFQTFSDVLFRQEPKGDMQYWTYYYRAMVKREKIN